VEVPDALLGEVEVLRAQEPGRVAPGAVEVALELPTGEALLREVGPVPGTHLGRVLAGVDLLRLLAHRADVTSLPAVVHERDPVRVLSSERGGVKVSVELREVARHLARPDVSGPRRIELAEPGDLISDVHTPEIVGECLGDLDVGADLHLRVPGHQGPELGLEQLGDLVARQKGAGNRHREVLLERLGDTEGGQVGRGPEARQNVIGLVHDLKRASWDAS
jgi:hypothetical protein